MITDSFKDIAVVHTEPSILYTITLLGIPHFFFCPSSLHFAINNLAFARLSHTHTHTVASKQLHAFLDRHPCVVSCGAEAEHMSCGAEARCVGSNSFPNPIPPLFN